MIDRVTDVLKTADGSRFSPALIENKLKFSPFVREAVVVGEDRPFVVALIQIDMGNVGNWAEARRLPFTTFKDLSGKPEVAVLIGEAVTRVNQDLPKCARIRGFALFDKELDADDDELTRTQKVRRATILVKYRDMIEGLYPGASGPEASREERVSAGGGHDRADRLHAPADHHRRGGGRRLLADGARVRADLQGLERGQLRAGRAGPVRRLRRVGHDSADEPPPLRGPAATLGGPSCSAS